MSGATRTVERRIRNRLIEWLDTVASSKQGEDDLNDLVNQWDDWVPHEPTAGRFASQVFTSAEVQALISVQVEIEKFSEASPRMLDAECWPGWGQVKVSAQAALSCFSVRGFLPEDEGLGE
jgi:hypothetical protein